MASIFASGLQARHVTERLRVRRTPFPGGSNVSPRCKVFMRGLAADDPRGVVGGPSDTFDRARKSGVLGAANSSCEPLARDAEVSEWAPKTFCFTLNSWSTKPTTAKEPAHIAKQLEFAKQANPVDEPAVAPMMARRDNVNFWPGALDVRGLAPGVSSCDPSIGPAKAISKHPRHVMPESLGCSKMA